MPILKKTAAIFWPEQRLEGSHSENQKVEHLFVDPGYQGIGLGRRLWEHLRDDALRSGNPGLFKVNSSLNAVPIYERFGFVVESPKVERYGGAYVPMIRRLAASD